MGKQRFKKYRHPRLTTSITKARGIIKELNINSVNDLNLNLIAAYYNILVVQKNLNGMDGSLLRNNEEAIITVNNSIKEIGKKRFVIAHELGHYFLHPDTRQFDILKEQDIYQWSYKSNPEEFEANTFAAELLMPDSLFEPCITNEEPSFQLISNLADQFNTTFTATAIRLVKLIKEPCALVASEKLRRKWFTANEHFEFRLNEDESIRESTCAAEIHAGITDSSRDDKIPAGAWIEDYEEDYRNCITEDSIALGRYGLILSLLWIKDAI